MSFSASKKDPDMRWPTADALADALEQQRYTAELTPLPPEPIHSGTFRTPTQSHEVQVAPVKTSSTRARVLGGGAAVLALSALAVMLSSGKSGPQSAVAFDAPKTVIVADVENRTADSTLGDLLSEALRTELQESKIVTLMTPAATASALQRMQKPAASRVSAALARELAEREGVPLVIEGRIQKVGNTYLVRAAMVSPADGAEQSAVQETAANEDGLIAAIGRLARRTRERLGESSAALTALPPMERVTTTSLDALRKYTEAIRLSDGMASNHNPRREMALLEEAVALDSTFAMAWRRLGMLQSRGDERMDFSSARMLRGKASLKRAYDLRAKLSPVERGLTEAAYFTFVDADRGRAAAAYHAILNEQPGNRIALNNLASGALESGAFERVREYGARFVALDSTHMEAWPWVIWGAYGTGRTAEARAARAAMRRIFTSREEVAQVDELDVQWLSVERDWPAVEKLARAQLAQARNPRAIERLTTRLAMSFEMRGMLSKSWDVQDSLLQIRSTNGDTSAVRESRGAAARLRYFDRAWLAGDTVGVARGIRDYIAASGVNTWRMQDRPFFNLIFDYTLAGDARAARARFVAYRAEVLRQNGRGDLPPPESPLLASLEGQLQLSEGRPRDAVRLLQPLVPDAMTYPQPEMYHLGAAYVSLGIRDSARLWFARITDTPDPRRAWSESAFRARALVRLCDLADTPARRQQWCGALASEWKDADPILQPIVARARQRMAE